MLISKLEEAKLGSTSEKKPAALIELRDISKTYRVGELDVPVLKGVSLTINKGEFVALMGASGSGKTTLMNILGCLDRPTDGRYWLNEREVGQLPADERALLRVQKIGFVFQTFNLLSRTSALGNVMMPLSYAADSSSDRQGRESAQALLQRMGLGDRLDHEPSQLSGGQQQRVAIARSLVNRPSLLLADEPTGNLDSRTSEEVLQIFQRLNREEAVTVILVTHDENVARHARRIIRIRDGLIEADSGVSRFRDEVADAAPPRLGETQMQRSSRGYWTQSKQMLFTALNGLRRNLLRATLTTLGIIIGIAAVIAMMELGRGSAKAIERTIASIGANNLLIVPGAASSGDASLGTGTAMTLSPQDAEAILLEVPAVRAAAPIVRAKSLVVYGNRNWAPNFIYGTTPAFLDVRDWSISEGEIFTESDVRNVNKVCVIGLRLAQEFFARESPIGKEVRIQNVPFKVIGVLATKGANMMGADQDDILLAPWTTIKFHVNGSSFGGANQVANPSSGSKTAQSINSLSQLYPNLQSSPYPLPSETAALNTPMITRFINVDQILASVRSTGEIQGASEKISKILRELHRIRPDKPDDFYIRDMTESSRALSSTTTTMTQLLLAVALISLVVGGVGIMNIMLVSVTERTREIGLRMAVGGRSRIILLQFLLESVVLCFFGGIAGILAGQGISYLITAVLHWPTELSPAAIAAAFTVSVTVGLVFGFYPAWKAARLDPITALRYE